MSINTENGPMRTEMCLSDDQVNSVDSQMVCMTSHKLHILIKIQNSTEQKMNHFKIKV